MELAKHNGDATSAVLMRVGVHMFCTLLNHATKLLAANTFVTTWQDALLDAAEKEALQPSGKPAKENTDLPVEAEEGEEEEGLEVDEELP